MNENAASSTDLETIVVPRTSDLGDNFEVRRALPSRERRMVGPFVFLDEMGPHVFAPGRGLDVRPHPHIGLATVTYLFEGEIHHRDSLGTSLAIRPGEVNWMTAGRGIVHSERSALEQRQQEHRLAGLQCWVALPRAYEETEPDFVHVDAPGLPRLEGDGVRACVIAGSFDGTTAPVPVLSPLFYVDVQLDAGAAFVVPPQYQERAAYVVAGRVRVGKEGVHESGRMLVLRPGRPVDLHAEGGPARLMLLGGEPLDGPRAVVWNFVSSSAERLEQAKEDWRQQRFAPVPDEIEFIPLPEVQGKPVFYP